MLRVTRRGVLGLGVGAALTPLRLSAQSAVPVIAAASDLKFAMDLIAANFTVQTGMQVSMSYGSTGNISRQIRQGAPFEVFMAADETFVFDLARNGFTQDDGALYGIGRLVILVPNGSALQADGGLDDLEAALADGRLVHFAIANPEHAPYGMRAREALQHKGLWAAIQPMLVLGENVAQAAQFATSGNAQGGIVAYALALSPQVAQLGTSALISDDWHAPLRQRMVLTKIAGPTAQAFYAYLQGPAARAVFDTAGFTLPVTG